MKKLVFFIAAAFTMQAHSVFAWGSRGHKIVAQIARICLSKHVVDSVQYYLGDMSFEDAAVWMDEIRSDNTYDYLKPMHYINIEKDKTYVASKGPNIINELDLVINQLESREPRKKDTINNSLKILFHLVGDLHQPLHAGYGEDKGGNTVNVSFFGEFLNLHKLWDTKIIETENITTKACLMQINKFSKQEKAEIQKIDPVEWMNESRSFLKEVYSFKDDRIDSAYISRSIPIIEQQLAKAGMRLASVLNQTFRRATENEPLINSKPLSE